MGGSVVLYAQGDLDEEGEGPYDTSDSGGSADSYSSYEYEGGRAGKAAAMRYQQQVLLLAPTCFHVLLAAWCD